MRNHTISGFCETDVEIQGGAVSINELATVEGHYRVFVLGYDDANGHFLSAVSSQLTPKHDEMVSDVFGKYADVTSGDADIAAALGTKDLKDFARNPSFHSALLRAPRVYVDKDVLADGLTADLTAHYMTSRKSNINAAPALAIELN